jgi:4'-phosphopantetheinyl transferase
MNARISALSDSNWSAAPAEPKLTDDDIHVWRAFLDSARASAAHLEKTLAEDELSRASRFVFERDRGHFVTARSILRSILSRYLRRPAASIVFSYAPEGKPRLHLEDADPPLRFNLSHSNGLAVYAVSRNREIGIDVERIRSGFNGEAIAQRFFSSKELAELRSLPLEQTDEGFFLCWTRKEAYVKARGSGLGISLNSFDVSLRPGLPERLVSADSNRWMLRSFRPADRFVGALVAEGSSLNVRLWSWNDQ